MTYTPSATPLGNQSASTPPQLGPMLRNYWTNAAPTNYLQNAIDFIIRPYDLQLPIILEEGRRPHRASPTNPPPYAQVNTAGQPIKVLPTLVATANSYAFRDNGQGTALNFNNEQCALTMIERERALGYADNDTAAKGFTDSQRHKVQGRCMDATAMTVLIIYIKIVLKLQAYPPCTQPSALIAGGGGADSSDDEEPSPFAFAAINAMSPEDNVTGNTPAEIRRPTRRLYLPSNGQSTPESQPLPMEAQ
jgi:hypothetical protein